MVIIYPKPDKTVATIADRNNLLYKIDNMVVTVEDAIADPDAGAGVATYRWNTQLNKWLLLSKSTEKNMSFITEEKIIVDGKVIPSEVPANNILWDIFIVEDNTIIAELRLEQDIIVSASLISGLGNYEGKKLRFTYAYGSVNQQLATYVDERLAEFASEIDTSVSNDVIDTLTILAGGNAKIVNSTTPALSAIPKYPLTSVLTFDVSLPSNNEEMISLDADNNIMVFKMKGSYNFTSAVQIKSNVSASRDITFNIIDVDTETIVYSEVLSGVLLASGNTEFFQIVTPFNITTDISSEEPLRVRVEVTCSDTGFELRSFNSVISTANAVTSGAGLPDQTGQTGKILSTDGGEAIWVDPIASTISLNMRYAGVILDLTSSPGGVGASTDWLKTWFDNSTIDSTQKLSDKRLLLKAGRTYRIAGGVTGFNGSTAAELSTKIYVAKVSDSVFTEVQGGYSYQITVNSTGSYVRNAFANCYIKAEEDMWVECRVNYFAGTVSYYASRYSITEYLNVTGEGAITLPSVTNQSGKFLSNNGTDIEWVKPEFNGLSELPQYKLGVEVLTSERWHNGKPIYQKVIDFGVLPNATSKSVAHGITDADVVWLDRGASMVYLTATPTTAYGLEYGTNLSTDIYAWNTDVSNTSLRMYTYTNRTTFSAYMTIKYTKSTDTANSPVKLIGSAYNISSNEYVLPYTRNGKTVYGMEVDFGALPNTATKTVTIPNYNSEYKYTVDTVNSYAYDPIAKSSRTLPTAHVSNLIDISISGDKIYVTCSGNRSNFTETKVVLNYTKN